MIRLSTRLAVAAAALALVAGTQPAAALDKFTVAAPQKGFWDTAFPYLGQEKGFFKEQGIELDIQWTEGGADTQQAVISGSIDIGLSTGMLGVLSAFSKGAPVVLASSEMTGASDLYWYVRADSPIKSLADIEGKTVGFSRPGSSSYTIAAALIKKSGKNAKLVSTGGPPATLTQVMSGQVDVGWCAVPINLNLINEGKLRVVALGNDAPGAANQTVRVNITNATVYKQRHDALKRFFIAYQKSIDWAYSGADVPEVYGKFANVPASVVNDLRNKFTPKTAVSLSRIEGLDVTMREAIEAKRLDKALTPDQEKAFLAPVRDLNH
jgi:NitT/TauT family transport system substrate-binding protein